MIKATMSTDINCGINRHKLWHKLDFLEKLVFPLFLKLVCFFFFSGHILFPQRCTTLFNNSSVVLRNCNNNNNDIEIPTS